MINENIMKKVCNLYKWLVVSSFVLLSACYEDLGNYAYEDINEVTVEEFNEANAIVINRFDTLIIVPEISSSIASNEENYSYRWMISTIDAQEDFEIGVSDEKVLEVQIPYVLGEYQVNLYVADLETGVEFMQQAKLTVTNGADEGWLLLTDNNGIRRMDMISRLNGKNLHEKVLLDVFAPTKIDLSQVHKIYSRKTRTWQWMYYCLGIDTYTWLEGNTMLWDESMEAKYEFHGRDIGSLKPQNMLTNLSSMDNRIVVADGDFYMMDYMYGSGFGFKGNIYNGVPFKVSEYVWDWKQGLYPVFYIYDKDNRRFMQASVSWSGNISLYELEDDLENNLLFNTGKDLIYAENYRYGNAAYALLKNPEGTSIEDYSLMGFELMSGQGGTYNLNSSRINEASSYTISTTLSLIYYAVGNKLYKYDFLKGSNELEMSYPEGAEITYLNFRARFNLPYKYHSGESTIDEIRENELLIVGINDNSKEVGSTGSMYLYKEKSNDPLVQYREYYGVGKILDINFKEKF